MQSKFFWGVSLFFGFFSFLFGQKNVEEVHKNLKNECSECHFSVSFEKINFDHKKTGYELKNKHKLVECRDCHEISDFSVVSENCSSCHLDVHNGKLSNCERCHDDKTFRNANTRKTHAQTQFPLLGKHAGLGCEVCHKGSLAEKFTQQTNLCVNCHEQKYFETEKPNHLQTGFEAECSKCHNFMGWQPANFYEHDKNFRIYFGKHRGVWKDCETCHANFEDFTQFSCFTGCHEHSEKSRLDKKHDDVSGYFYESYKCYNCHSGV